MSPRVLQLGKEGRAQPRGVPAPRLDPPIRKTSWFIARGMLGLSAGGTRGGWGGDSSSIPPQGGSCTACPPSPRGRDGGKHPAHITVLSWHPWRRPHVPVPCSGSRMSSVPRSAGAAGGPLRCHPWETPWSPTPCHHRRAGPQGTPSPAAGVHCPRGTPVPPQPLAQLAAWCGRCHRATCWWPCRGPSAPGRGESRARASSPPRSGPPVTTSSSHIEPRGSEVALAEPRWPRTTAVTHPKLPPRGVQHPGPKSRHRRVRPPAPRQPPAHPATAWQGSSPLQPPPAPPRKDKGTQTKPQATKSCPHAPCPPRGPTLSAPEVVPRNVPSRALPELGPCSARWPLLEEGSQVSPCPTSPQPGATKLVAEGTGGSGKDMAEPVLLRRASPTVPLHKVQAESPGSGHHGGDKPLATGFIIIFAGKLGGQDGRRGAASPSILAGWARVLRGPSPGDSSCLVGRGLTGSGVLTRLEEMLKERRCQGPVGASSSLGMSGAGEGLLGSHQGTQLHRAMGSWRGVTGVWPGHPAPHGCGDRSPSLAAGEDGDEQEVALGTCRALPTSVSVALPIPALSWRLD